MFLYRIINIFKYIDRVKIPKYSEKQFSNLFDFVFEKCFYAKNADFT